MTPEAQSRQQLIFWFTMLASIVMYFVIVRLTPPKSSEANPPLVNILLVVSLALVVTSLGVKGLFLRRARDLNNPGLQRTALILALVCCEGAALLGVVAWFLTGSTRSYWLLLIGFAGVALHYPNRE